MQNLFRMLNSTSSPSPTNNNNNNSNSNSNNNATSSSSLTTPTSTPPNPTSSSSSSSSSSSTTSASRFGQFFWGSSNNNNSNNSSSNASTSNSQQTTTGGSQSKANTQQETIATLTKQQITDFFNHVHGNNLTEVSRLIDENIEYLHCREDTEWKYTALHWASQKGFDAMVSILINKGVNVSQEASKYNWKAIHLACRFGHPRVVVQLLDAGENVNVVQDDDDKANAIHWAAQFGHEEVFNLLISRGADYTFKNAKGNSLIHIGACYGFCFVIDRCLELGCDINMRTDNKWEYTGLHWAAQFDKPHVIRHLIERGAKIHLKSRSNNFTPLELAEKYNNKECAQVLKDRMEYEKEMEWYRIMAPSRRMLQRQKENCYVDMEIICDLSRSDVL